MDTIRWKIWGQQWNEPSLPRFLWYACFRPSHPVVNVLDPFIQDVFYGDIDTFQGERNFLIRTEFKDLPQYVDDKKAQNIHYVTILDPCIAADTTYAAFQRGLNSEDQHAFIRWPDGYTDSNNQSYTSHDATQPPYLLGHVSTFQATG